MTQIATNTEDEHFIFKLSFASLLSVKLEILPPSHNIRT
jgi:hypothetical protein